MLYMCEYTWHSGTTREQVWDLIGSLGRQGESGVTVRGYYNLIGGGAGYFLLERDDPLRINELLVPTMGLVAWDVRQVFERDWDAELTSILEQHGQSQ